ncbi:hypothetical protein [Parendozoicomonas haliclonae]|uniref:Uncharacterized protein n=1 Tax=Parendozoicomonas haliclonae TaxID=1960125 RepID=A0A1X7AM61_9GAMM|nr:hypothetical protein [Parendozoicomonas haliclonae]SMA49284.1 hypothetical protein EHSB41UT_03159 [Parendozoicomonas haliclonae]
MQWAIQKGSSLWGMLWGTPAASPVGSSSTHNQLPTKDEATVNPPADTNIQTRTATVVEQQPGFLETLQSHTPTPWSYLYVFGLETLPGHPTQKRLFCELALKEPKAVLAGLDYLFTRHGSLSKIMTAQEDALNNVQSLCEYLLHSRHGLSDEDQDKVRGYKSQMLEEIARRNLSGSMADVKARAQKRHLELIERFNALPETKRIKEDIEPRPKRSAQRKSKRQ